MCAADMGVASQGSQSLRATENGGAFLGGGGCAGAGYPSVDTDSVCRNVYKIPLPTSLQLKDCSAPEAVPTEAVSLMQLHSINLLPCLSVCNNPISCSAVYDSPDPLFNSVTSMLNFWVLWFLHQNGVEST